jgi:hypothetical protein
MLWRMSYFYPIKVQKFHNLYKLAFLENLSRLKVIKNLQKWMYTQILKFGT